MVGSEESYNSLRANLIIKMDEMILELHLGYGVTPFEVSLPNHSIPTYDADQSGVPYFSIYNREAILAIVKEKGI